MVAVILLGQFMKRTFLRDLEDRHSIEGRAWEGGGGRNTGGLLIHEKCFSNENNFVRKGIKNKLDLNKFTYYLFEITRE